MLIGQDTEENKTWKTG